MQDPRRVGIMVVLVVTLVLPGCMKSLDARTKDLAPLQFGLDAAGAQALAQNGTHVEFAELWVGAWNLEHGWRDTEDTLRRIEAANRTPFVEFYYWGDDLTPACFAQGCETVHGHKDRAEWDRLAQEFVQLVARLDVNRTVWIVLESEFNKGPMVDSVELDRALAEKAAFFHEHLPTSWVVLGFGAWASGFYFHFDEAAAQADAMGLQALRAGTRDPPERFREAANETLRDVRELSRLFGKPVVLHDVALASWPEPDGLPRQASALEALRDASAPLRRSGVEVVVYRSYLDTTNASTTDYFGPAERTWGLAWGNGTMKPAAEVWLEWVNGTR